MTALDRIAAEILMFPNVYVLEAARIKRYGNYDLENIEISGIMDLSRLTVSDFESALPRDISFNPYRVMKSFLKQIYEIGIKEKRGIVN